MILYNKTFIAFLCSLLFSLEIIIGKKKIIDSTVVIIIYNTK